MSDRRCPNTTCREELARPAREGGVIYNERYVRRTPTGAVLIACKGCGTEVEIAPAAAAAASPTGGRLVFPRPIATA